MSPLLVTPTADAGDGFELKISGYFNLTQGGVLHGVGEETGSSVGVVPEAEIELTAQYHLESGTICIRR